MNHVQLVGVVASQVRLDEFGAGTASPRTKATFLCAVRRWNRSHEPDWIRVEAWGVQAQNLVRFNGKGSRVAIAGHLRGNFYNPDDKDTGGQLRLSVVAESITYLSAPRPQAGAPQEPAPRSRK
ncbi:MAG: single-stranded DNA-binding protein [Candidatus Dormibacteria bacterium]